MFLLIAWTAIETGTVALTHSHGDCGAAHGLSAAANTNAATPVCGHDSDCHHHSADVNRGAEATHRVRYLAKSRNRTPILAARTTTAHGHPDDCTVCRHLSQSRLNASFSRLSVALESRVVRDCELPVAPIAAAAAVLHLRGPPGRVFLC